MRATQHNSVLKLLHKDERLRLVLIRPSIWMSVCVGVWKLFSKMLSGGQNPQLHTVTLHLVCGIRNGGGRAEKDDRKKEMKKKTATWSKKRFDGGSRNNNLKRIVQSEKNIRELVNDK